MSRGEKVAQDEKVTRTDEGRELIFDRQRDFGKLLMGSHSTGSEMAGSSRNILFSTSCRFFSSSGLAGESRKRAERYTGGIASEIRL